MMLKKIILSLLILPILAAAISFAVYVYVVESMSRNYEKTDVVVVFTGGSGRIDEGIRLYKSQHAKYLFITGVESADYINQHVDVLSDKNIFIDRNAGNTLLNVKELRRFVQDQKINSVTLITSNYHMPRVMSLLDSFEIEAEIYPWPVYYNGGIVQKLLVYGKEFVKFCVLIVFLHI